MIQNKDKWKECRVDVLKRILVATHVKHTMPTGGSRYFLLEVICYVLAIKLIVTVDILGGLNNMIFTL